MAFSSYCFSQAQMPFKVGCSGFSSRTSCSMGLNQRTILAQRSVNTELFARQAGMMGANISGDWSFFRRPAVAYPNLGRAVEYRKSSRVSASCLPSSQLASTVFTVGTAAVLPFYTLMVAAPKAEFTKKLMESSIPYIVLGLLYAYLLYLSWTPETIRLMFASKYWLPELPAIAKLFSSEMTLASAWIHLLVIDLFAARSVSWYLRYMYVLGQGQYIITLLYSNPFKVSGSSRQVFHDGLQDNIETRHSVSLCLLFCPVGVLIHFITKVLTKNLR